MIKQEGLIKLINVQVEIPVYDMSRARNFYQKNFGFIIKREERDFVEFENNILLRSFREKPGKSQRSEKEGIKILFWVKNISVTYKEMIDSGIWVDSPPDEDTEDRYFLFQDSEGNICKAMQKK